jgi:hypothetical protein
LLGIARRKAGTQISCPQCFHALTVPIQDAVDDLNELDELLGSRPHANGSVSDATQPLPQRRAPTAAPTMELPEPESPRPVAPPAPRPAPAAASVAAVPPPRPAAPPAPATAPAPRPQRTRKPGEEEPLLIEDVDELLGMARPGERFELDEEPPPRVKPVSGMDANSLDDGSGKVVLSPQKATILVIAVVVLLGIAFTAGFLISSRLG